MTDDDSKPKMGSSIPWRGLPDWIQRSLEYSLRPSEEIVAEVLREMPKRRYLTDEEAEPYLLPKFE